MPDRPVRRIPCDLPEQKMWNLFLILENEVTAKRYLEEKYSSAEMEKPGQKAFHSAQPLVYYVKQAREIYRIAGKSELFIRPLLTYYGMMNLCKAWLITMDPEYPRNTAVLRHGVSTRKRKKQNYNFLADEVRIQREGLLSELIHIHRLQRHIGEVWKMKELFSLIPEVQDGYRQLFRESSLYPVAVFDYWKASNQGMPFYVEESILDNGHVTASSFLQRLHHYASDSNIHFSLLKQGTKPSLLGLRWHHPHVFHVNLWEKGFAHPWFREDRRGGYYLYAGDNRLSTPLPEIFVHYLLLFSLGMLCRYETALWGDMIYGMTTEDMVLIQEFLDVTQRKFPNLILNALFEEKLIFSPV